MKVKIVVAIVFIILVIVYLASKLLKKKHYAMIDQINDRKNKLFSHTIPDEFQKAGQEKLAGQSKKTYEKIYGNWQKIETSDFPKLENYLFEAEQSTDRFHFSKATENEKAAQELINRTTIQTEELSDSLKKLMENEEMNREKSTKAEEEYQQLRNKLLTHSFTYGTALEALEKQVTDMEQDFTEFKKATQGHDYVEANAVLETLMGKIDSLKEQADLVPAFFDLIEEEIYPQLSEINETYESLSKSGYGFQDEFIKEESDELRTETERTLDLVNVLKLTEAKIHLKEISSRIESVYERMENEINAKVFVTKSTTEMRSAFTYLLEKNRRLRIESDRLNQNYVLTKEELGKGEEYHQLLEKLKNKFELVSDEVSSEVVVFSNVQHNYEEIMNELETLFVNQDELQRQLESLKIEEEQAQKNVLECHNELSGIRRHLEMQRLPGLPDDFLDLYFETDDRLGKLEKEMNKSRIDIHQIQKMLLLAKEDVSQVKDEAGQMLTEVILIEHMVQYLNRYRKDHPSIATVIDESKKLFDEKYDYKTSLKLLSEKLDEIEPGASEDMRKQYETEKEQQRN